jgi:hypothetical protein
MMRRRHCLVTPLLIALTGCAAPVRPFVDTGPPRPEPLYNPDQVKPGRLEYAPDRSTFAPVLTERFAYPTQPEANAAYRRLLATAPVDRTHPASIWLFGCKPGAIDEQTARVTRYRGPVVHCATDFLDSSGRRARGETASTITTRCGICSPSIHHALPLPGATASELRRTFCGGSPAGPATSRRRSGGPRAGVYNK